MVSVAALAAAPDKIYTWYAVRDVATPSTAFTIGDAGQTRTLADFKGQVVLLNLWATWCTPCLKELPTLDALEEKYAEQGLVVLPLSVDRFSFEQLRSFVDKQELELPHLAQDASGAFNKALVGRGLPVTYLLDREGTLVWRYDGATDWMQDEHRQKIEALLAR